MHGGSPVRSRDAASVASAPSHPHEAEMRDLSCSRQPDGGRAGFVPAEQHQVPEPWALAGWVDQPVGAELEEVVAHRPRRRRPSGCDDVLPGATASARSMPAARARRHRAGRRCRLPRPRSRRSQARPTGRPCARSSRPRHRRRTNSDTASARAPASTGPPNATPQSRTRGSSDQSPDRTFPNLGGEC